MQIEFLPERYADRRESRQRNVWRTALLTLFGGVMAVSSLLQWYQGSAIQREVERLAPLRDATHANTRRLELLRSELATRQREALLYSYLQTHVPRTQILAEIVKPLPQSVTLTSLELGGGRRVVAAANRTTGAASSKVAKPKTTHDLETLRGESGAEPLTVTLRGLTMNVIELHRFLDQLRKSPLFLSANLDSLHAVADSENINNSEFRIRLELRPGGERTASAAAGTSRVLAASSDSRVQTNERTAASRLSRSKR